MAVSALNFPSENGEEGDSGRFKDTGGGLTLGLQWTVDAWTTWAGPIIGPITQLGVEITLLVSTIF